MTILDEIKTYIRDVPDFPKPGILFKDFTPLLENGPAFRKTIDLFAERYRDRNITKVVCVESRGFVVGAPLAYAIEAGVVVVRKPGKLPYNTDQVSYTLEYGEDTLEIHQGSIEKGENVLLIDDLLATGGTMGATKKLVEKQGANVVECSFVIELGFLKGRDALTGTPVHSLLQY